MYGLQTIFEQKQFSLEIQQFILRILFRAHCFKSENFKKDLLFAGFQDEEITKLVSFVQNNTPDSLSIDTLSKTTFDNLLDCFAQNQTQLQCTEKWLNIVINRELHSHVQVSKEALEQFAMLVPQYFSKPKYPEYTQLIVLADSDRTALQNLQFMINNSMTTKIKKNECVMLINETQEKNSPAQTRHSFGECLDLNTFLAFNKLNYQIIKTQRNNLSESLRDFFIDKNKSIAKFYLANFSMYAKINHRILFVIPPLHLKENFQHIETVAKEFPEFFKEFDVVCNITSSPDLLQSYILKAFPMTMPAKENDATLLAENINNERSIVVTDNHSHLKQAATLFYSDTFSHLIKNTGTLLSNYWYRR